MLGPYHRSHGPGNLGGEGTRSSLRQPDHDLPGGNTPRSGIQDDNVGLVHDLEEARPRRAGIALDWAFMARRIR